MIFQGQECNMLLIQHRRHFMELRLGEFKNCFKCLLFDKCESADPDEPCTNFPCFDKKVCATWIGAGCMRCSIGRLKIKSCLRCVEYTKCLTLLPWNGCQQYPCWNRDDCKGYCGTCKANQRRMEAGISR